MGPPKKVAWFKELTFSNMGYSFGEAFAYFAMSNSRRSEAVLRKALALLRSVKVNDLTRPGRSQFYQRFCPQGLPKGAEILVLETSPLPRPFLSQLPV